MRRLLKAAYIATIFAIILCLWVLCTIAIALRASESNQERLGMIANVIFGVAGVWCLIFLIKSIFTTESKPADLFNDGVTTLLATLLLGILVFILVVAMWSQKAVREFDLTNKLCIALRQSSGMIIGICAISLAILLIVKQHMKAKTTHRGNYSPSTPKWDDTGWTYPLQNSQTNAGYTEQNKQWDDTGWV